MNSAPEIFARHLAVNDFPQPGFPSKSRDRTRTVGVIKIREI
jgi:hypothetical protein